MQYFFLKNVKCNIDSSFDLVSSQAGIGMVMRNEDEIFIACKLVPCMRVLDRSS